MSTALQDVIPDNDFSRLLRSGGDAPPTIKLACGSLFPSGKGATSADEERPPATLVAFEERESGREQTRKRIRDTLRPRWPV